MFFCILTICLFSRNQERPRLNAVYQLRPQGDCYILTKEGTLTAKQFMERIVRKEAQDRLRGMIPLPFPSPVSFRL